MAPCGAGADQFIERHFKDCVYNVRDYIGFCLGLAAIVFWIIAQLPQFYRNYKTKSAEALSPWFLAQWLLGDTSNCIGALLQGQQLPTTVYTAMYFVVADMFMMMQYIYYGALQRRREKVLKLQAHRRHHHHRRHHARDSDQFAAGPEHHFCSRTPGGEDSSLLPEGGQQQQWHQQPGHWQPQRQQHERRRLPQQTAAVKDDDVSQQPVTLDQADDLQDGCSSSACTSSSNLKGCSLQRPGHSTLLSTAAVPAKGGASVPLQAQQQRVCDSCPILHPTANSVPSSSLCEAAGEPVLPASCAVAAAAAAAAGPQSLPGLRLGFNNMHWGGSRSVLAVGVLVSMGLVSLLVPASTTHGLFPASLSGQQRAGLPADGGSLAARAMQAGIPLQQGHSMHSTAAAAAIQDSVPVGSEADLPGGSSSGSRGWSRQQRLGDETPKDWSFLVGTTLGYLSSILYLSSRVSQIHKNYTRKSSEGLAIVMFMMAVCANLCTGTGIIVRTFTWVEFKEQLPWIIGSLGTIALDMIIMWQSTVYDKQGSLPVVGAGAVGQVQDDDHDWQRQQQQSVQRQHQHHRHRHPHGDHHERQYLLQQDVQQQEHGLGMVQAAAVVAAGSSSQAVLRQGEISVYDGQQQVAAHHYTWGPGRNS